jgi:two-component system, LytTR family, response regulator
MNTRSVRCLIVEDKEDDRDFLRELIAQTDQMEVVGECDTIVEAKRLYKEKQPDLVFLDNYLPGGTSGVEFLEQTKELNNRLVPVILTTAHPPTAALLSELQAIGRLFVLQKPFNVHQFEKVLKILPPLNIEDFEPPSQLRKPAFLSLSAIDNDGTRIQRMVNMKDIIFISSDGNMKDIYTKTGKKYEDRLGFTPFVNYGFRQIHKSHYVNFATTDYIQFSYKSETRKLIIKNLITNKEYRLDFMQTFTERLLLDYLTRDALI